jgi:tryptophanyl-tRNA synthetase
MLSKGRSLNRLLNQRNLRTLLNRHTERRCFASKALPSEKGLDHVIFSGIQPTGVPHLGNYLGALQQWVKLQISSPPSTKLLYSIVDLHAYTVSQNPKLLEQFGRETLATFLAIGLDPERSILFYQSSVGADAL